MLVCPPTAILHGACPVQDGKRSCFFAGWRFDSSGLRIFLPLWTAPFHIGITMREPGCADEQNARPQKLRSYYYLPVAAQPHCHTPRIEPRELGRVEVRGILLVNPHLPSIAHSYYYLLVAAAGLRCFITPPERPQTATYYELLVAA